MEKRKSSIHLDLRLKFVCQENEIKILSEIIAFQLYIFMWFVFDLTLFIRIPVNQTSKLTEFICLPILCLAHSFISYSCVFLIPVFLASRELKEP